MKRWLSAIGCAMVMTVAVTYAMEAPTGCTEHTAATDPEYILDAYRIPDDFDCCFHADDDKLSDFWMAFDSTDGLDLAMMGPDNLSYGPAVSDTNDAKITVHAVWNTHGIYFLFRVRDDMFGAPLSDLPDNPNTIDALEVAMDYKSAAELYNNPADEFYNIANSQISYNFWQLQIKFGEGGGGLDQISWNWLKDQFVDDPISKQIHYTNAIEWNKITQSGTGGIPRSEAESYGVFYEVVGTDNAAVETQEWKIEWEAIGRPFGSITGGSEGDKFALALGYDDFDQGASSISGIRWRCNADPWSTDNASGNSVDCWGDVELKSSLLDTLEALEGISMHTLLDSLCEDQCSVNDVIRTNGLRTPNALMAPTGDLRYFTVNGRHIGSITRALENGTLSRNSIILECRMDTEGHVIATRREIVSNILR